MRLLLNIIWFMFGGFATGLAWLFGGLVLAVTIVGLPYAKAAWRVAGFAFWPFGKEIVDRPADPADLGQGSVGCLLNVIWFIFGGWYLALAHVVIGLCEAVTIIGLPFAMKDFQLAGVALAPVGKMVVDK